MKPELSGIKNVFSYQEKDKSDNVNGQPKIHGERLFGCEYIGESLLKVPNATSGALCELDAAFGIDMSSF